MTCFIVDGNKKKISMTNDEFDLLWNSIEGEVSDFSTDTEEEIKKAKEKERKKKYNDVLNKKYKEEGYFKEYFIENDKSLECERCGCMIKNKSNMAKHLRTDKCKRIHRERAYQNAVEKVCYKYLTNTN